MYDTRPQVLSATGIALRSGRLYFNFLCVRHPPLPVIPAFAGIQTPVCPCKQQPARNLRAAEMKPLCVCIMAGKPHGAWYTGGLDSRLRGNDGYGASGL